MSRPNQLQYTRMNFASISQEYQDLENNYMKTELNTLLLRQISIFCPYMQDKLSRHAT